MYKIREIDYKQDNAGIVKLLQKTLGEKMNPQYLTWKHQQNPFGESFGLLAENDAGQIIGVRLFMWWELQTREGVMKAIRPVDAATDRDYRGKGIFSRLTLEGLERLEGKYDLIFNTPNDKSLPGNLKMGWKILPADYYYYLALANPLRKTSVEPYIFTDSSEQAYPGLEGSCKTSRFMQWRYKSPMYKKSVAVLEEQEHLLVYRIGTSIQKGVTFKFIIVVEYAGAEEKLSKMLRAVCAREKIWLYYFADFGNTKPLKKKLAFRRGKSLVVYRAKDPARLLEVDFSTGDLEGII